MMKFIKHTTVKIWIAVLLISIYLLGFRLNTRGVEVLYVSRNSSLSGIINPGYVIYSINGTKATVDLVKSFNGTYQALEIKTDHGTFYPDVNGTLGIDVSNVKRTKLNFGLDIEGGVRAIIAPDEQISDETLQRMIKTLELRINTYGLKEVSIRPIYSGDKKFVEIEMAAGTKQMISSLLSSQGKFEAVVPIKVKNGGTFSFDNPHRVKIVNGTVYIDGEELNGTTTIDGIDVSLRNVTGDYAYLNTLVFTGEDIKHVYTDPQHAGVRAQDNGYRFSFSILISNDAAQRFSKVTKNLQVVPTPQGDGYLSSKIYFYLDEKEMDSLQISAGLRGKVVTQPSITGYGKTQEEAISNMRRLQAILSSGSLPVSIHIVSMDEISPKLGYKFLKESAIAGLIAFAAVSLLIIIRYRDPKVVIPVLVSSLSEVIITLGIAALIGQTIDLPAIAGLIAAIGTSVDDQIMIIDEVEDKHEELSLKQRIKRAFMVIFGSAGTTVAAMVPLIFVGFGALKGFAIVSIIGILVSVLVSRPAFRDIVEDLVKR